VRISAVEFLRFWEKVDIQSDGCWYWTGAVKGNQGYGTLGIQTRNMGAHRFSLLWFVGEPPEEGCQALHSCDVKWCVNPEHLSWGTHSDNTADAVSRSRYRSGALHYASKINEDDVRQIRRFYEQGLTYVEIADHYPITDGAVRAIVNRKNWKHVA